MAGCQLHHFPHQHAPASEQALDHVGSIKAVHAVRAHHAVLQAQHLTLRTRVVVPLLSELSIYDSQQLVQVFPVHVAALLTGEGQ